MSRSRLVRYGVRALAVVGLATAAWLLSGSAAQADAGSPSDQLNVARVADSASASLGGLLQPGTGQDTAVLVTPVAQTMNSAAKPVLGVTSELLNTATVLGKTSPAAANQVAPGLVRTTRDLVTAVGLPDSIVAPVELVDPVLRAATPVFDPLTTVLAPVTGAVVDTTDPLADAVARVSGSLGLPVAPKSGPDTARTQVTAQPGVLRELSAPALLAGPGSRTAATPELWLRSSGTTDRDLVDGAQSVTVPVSPHSPPTQPAPVGPGTGSTTGSTGSLPGSAQDSGPLALVPASVIHCAPLCGVLPVTSFIGMSRDSAADPMVSPD